MTFLLALFSILVNILFTQNNVLVQDTNLNLAKVSYSQELPNKLSNNLSDKLLNEKEFVLPQQLSAKAYLIKERNGRVLLAKNEDKVFPIASISKLFTVYTALKFIPQNTIITLTQESINQEGLAGRFQVGERFLRDDLVKASLILSSNDAAYALSESYGVNNFMFLVNKVINSFQLWKTHLVEPTGISSGNVSSADDILKFVFSIRSEFPQIWDWSVEKNIILDGFWRRVYSNINLDILNKYDNLILMQKTGFTDQAGKSIVVVIKLPKSPEIGIVLLNDPEREKDLDIIISALKDYYE